MATDETLAEPATLREKFASMPSRKGYSYAVARPISRRRMAQLWHHKQWLDTGGRYGRRLENKKSINFTHALLQATDFSYAKLSNVDFTLADLDFARFLGADLVNAKLCCAHVEGTKFSGATLRDVDFREADNVETPFPDCRVEHLWRREAERVACLRPVYPEDEKHPKNSREKILSAPDFTFARLSDVDFEGASLKFSSFCGADLFCVNFSLVDLEGADFSGATLRHVDFTQAKNLETVCFGDARMDGFSSSTRPAFTPLPVETSPKI